jgi:plasmid stabilization system protein ParE
VSLYRLSPQARRDLEQVRLYLSDVPVEAAMRAKLQLRDGLRLIAGQPMMGHTDSESTRLIGEEIRSWLIPPYRVFYRASRSPIEFVAILHGARDLRAILRRRLQ